MNNIRLLVIGAGAIGRTHIDRIQRTPGLALAGIADPSDAGRALAESLGAPWAPDHISALERFQPQGAIVATPNTQHVPMALDCLARGVAALVEKPVADSVAEAQQLVDAQARSGVPVLVGHHRRHNPINQQARDTITSGKLGRLVGANAMAFAGTAGEHLGVFHQGLGATRRQRQIGMDAIGHVPQKVAGALLALVFNVQAQRAAACRHSLLHIAG